MPVIAIAVCRERPNPTFIRLVRTRLIKVGSEEQLTGWRSSPTHPGIMTVKLYRAAHYLRKRRTATRIPTTNVTSSRTTGRLPALCGLAQLALASSPDMDTLPLDIPMGLKR